ncbi:MAG TPA: hypothetical protein VGY58_11045 [Gemmataceae bacterium]|jgi:hypothetical protein|nr:hypothetical protein [Gemmataceae bacterium]
MQKINVYSFITGLVAGLILAGVLGVLREQMALQERAQRTYETNQLRQELEKVKAEK